MRRVLGVTAFFAVLCIFNGAAAQESGWGTPPPEEQPESGGGWGQTGQPEQPEQPPGGGWGQTDTPQAADTESPTGGATSGWGQPPASTPAPTPAPTPAATPAAAEERPELTGDRFRMAHRVALGAHNHMSGAFIAAQDQMLSGADIDLTTPWINFSFMYTISPLLTIDIFAGFMVTNTAGTRPEDDQAGDPGTEGTGTTHFELALGPRLLFNISSGDHARLYSGFGLALLVGLEDTYDREEDVCRGDCGGNDMYGFALAAPIGFEYRFRRVPNLIFSAEFNLHLVFESYGVREEDPDSTDPRLVGLNNVVIFGIGNPRREGSLNFVDFLSFLTIGFHYML